MGRTNYSIDENPTRLSDLSLTQILYVFIHLKGSLSNSRGNELVFLRLISVIIQRVDSQI